MIRNLKVVGVLAIATFALSATFAAAAQAQTLLHGSQYGEATQNYFKFGEEQIRCENSGVTYTGTDADGTATSLTLTPTYKDCFSFTGAGHEEDRPVTFTTNKCDYVLNQPSTNESKQMTGTLSMGCEKEGEEIVLKIYQFGTPTSHSFQVCELSIEQFSNRGHAIYKTVAGSPDDVTVEVGLSGIPYTKAGLCGSEPTTTDLAVKAKITLTAEEEEGPDDPRAVWIEETEETGTFRVGHTAPIPSTFTAGATPSTHLATVLHGEQYGETTQNYIEFGTAAEKQRLRCENSGVTYTGSDADGTATSLTLTPTYKDCFTFIGEGHEEDRPATFTTNKCDYVLNQPGTNESKQMTGTLSMACENEGEGMLVEIYQFGTPTSHSFQVCELSIEQFSNRGHAVYKTIAGSPDDVTVEVDLTGVPYTESGLCHSSQTRTNLSLKSRITLTAEDEEEQPRDIWISE